MGPGGRSRHFLYLNPSLSAARFANKVVHESHHIGLDSSSRQQEAVLRDLAEPQKKAVRWLGSFGEGEAMLAAAGSPSVHPHAQDDEAARTHGRLDRSPKDVAYTGREAAGLAIPTLLT